MIDFLDNANKLMCKTELLPQTHQLPCCCVIFELFLLPDPSVHACQIILRIPKIPVCVSNYTADNEDMCLCVKLYRSYLR